MDFKFTTFKLLFAVTGITLISAGANPYYNARLAVIDNRLGKNADFTHVFVTADVLYWQSSVQGKFVSLGKPDGVPALVSNPSVVRLPTNQTQVFVQGSDGQVYARTQTLTPPIYSPWFKVGDKLPSPPKRLTFTSKTQGRDAITAIVFKGKTTVFVTSIGNPSQLWWIKGTAEKFPKWSNIGGNLMSDVSVVYNKYSGYFEAFAIFTDKKAHRMWQRSDDSWSGWRVQGINPPSPVPLSRPTAHGMTQTVFNGMLEVFVLGTDGRVHHIWQTTCDGVDNPWGWCTWWTWDRLANSYPSPGSPINALTSGRNVHGGNELFTVDVHGTLWYSYQLKRDGSWKDWQAIKSRLPISNLPRLVQSDSGWWSAYVLQGSGLSVGVITQPSEIVLDKSTIGFGGNFTVHWSIPIDEAVNSDWIGIYPSGASNEKYVNYKYVQGGQNPASEAVPSGSVEMRAFLPDGPYDVRYLVNRNYVSVISTIIKCTNDSKEEKWVQLFKGINTGLGRKNESFIKCVKDGEKTVATFEQAVTSFKDRKIYTGLALLGKTIYDLYEAFLICGETDIAKSLEALSADMIACFAADKCLKFAIDMAKDIVILYEDVYEIYGDIRGSINSWDISAFTQAGFNFGRVINVCISMPN